MSNNSSLIEKIKAKIFKPLGSENYPELPRDGSVAAQFSFNNERMISIFCDAANGENIDGQTVSRNTFALLNNNLVPSGIDTTTFKNIGGGNYLMNSTLVDGFSKKVVNVENVITESDFKILCENGDSVVITFNPQNEAVVEYYVNQGIIFVPSNQEIVQGSVTITITLTLNETQIYATYQTKKT